MNDLRDFLINFSKVSILFTTEFSGLEELLDEALILLDSFTLSAGYKGL